MKIASNIAGALLGALFLLASLMVLLHLADMPPIPPDTPAGHFMAAFGPSGYMTFVKVCELIGGLLVIVPFTRNIGLLVLGPIIINILAFHIFITKGAGLEDPMLIAIVLLAGFLLWSGRKAFAGLLGSRP
jgi:hypothetical protein